MRMIGWVLRVSSDTGLTRAILIECAGEKIPSELLQAIAAVVRGATYITPLVTGEMLDTLMTGSRKAMTELLTVRQREILQLLAEGKTMKETAHILHLTSRTIAFHKHRIMNSLKRGNNADLVRYAFKSGLVQI